MRQDRSHRFQVSTVWTGNSGSGTASYKAYSRDHEYRAPGKATAIAGSSSAEFRGDGTRYNPEELLVAAVSSCHMLWMLHLCADAGIVVTEYSDDAAGEMIEHSDGSGEFARILLRPRMTVTDPARIPDALALHERAREMCFIARSVRFPVDHEPEICSVSTK